LRGGPTKVYVDPESDIDCESDADRELDEKISEEINVPQAFDDWKTAILQMRKAVEIWDRIRSRTADSRAVRQLREMINGLLNEARVTVSFEMASAPPNQPKLHIVPTNLHGAMWLQLAQALEDNKSYRRCKICSRWFELSPETGARTSRHYCSDACRSRAYRSRKERARKLHAKGTAIRKIAEELGSNVETVKKWIAG
jgi:hypothetical protein